MMVENDPLDKLPNLFPFDLQPILLQHLGRMPWVTTITMLLRWTGHEGVGWLNGAVMKSLICLGYTGTPLMFLPAGSPDLLNSRGVLVDNSIDVVRCDMFHCNCEHWVTNLSAKNGPPLGTLFNCWKCSQQRGPKETI